MASRAAMTLSEVKERTRDLTERYGLSVDLPVRALLLALHDAVACAEVIAEWDGGRAMLVGVLDATNTTLYGAIASGTEREWVREQERRSR